MEEIFERICSMLSDQLDIDIDANPITMETSFEDDLEADSLDVVDMIMSLEDEFGIEVPDEAVENFHTVGDVVRFVEDNT